MSDESDILAVLTDSSSCPTCAELSVRLETLQTGLDEHEARLAELQEIAAQIQQVIECLSSAQSEMDAERILSDEPTAHEMTKDEFLARCHLLLEMYGGAGVHYETLTVSLAASGIRPNARGRYTDRHFSEYKAMLA